jgi:hypothetical protein
MAATGEHHDRSGGAKADNISGLTDIGCLEAWTVAEHGAGPSSDGNFLDLIERNLPLGRER